MALRASLPLTVTPPCICAVIVTYHTDTAHLQRLLGSLSEVDTLVVVDNGSPDVEEKQLIAHHPNLTIKKLGVNKGIAAAQNEGVAIAASMNAEFVVFFDQDSVPQPGMIGRLHAAYVRLVGEGRRVACVGPRYVPARTGQPVSFIRVGWLRLYPQPCPNANTVIECDFLLSSGSLVPMSVLKSVGGMEEALFIDLVDTEWCLRARSAGYGVFGSCGALLEHRLGEDMQRVWLGRWRSFARHKPFRYYYIFRNALHLMRRGYVPLKCKVFFFKWLVALFVTFGMVAGRQQKELGMMLRGIWHGLSGRMGKLDPHI